jgi:single-strand DNA-binding protein
MAKFGLNRVILVGNLGKDPELRYVNQEIPLAKLRMAVSEPQGDGQVDTTWVDVSLWRGLAERAHRYARKGATVLVEGRLVERTWKNQQGEKRSRIEVEGQRFVMLGKPSDADQKQADFSHNPLGNVDPFGKLDEATGTDDLPF